LKSEENKELKLLTFDVASSFAFFRKNFSTTNALTFAVIPRSAVQGLISSIVGLSRSEFPDHLKESKIAVELRSPVRKMNMKYKHMNEKWWDETLSRYLNNRQFVLQKTREQISVPTSVELLVDVKYRIYVDAGEVNKKLSENLMHKQSYFTPYLGGSSMIASLKYLGEFDYEAAVTNDYLPVSSVIPFIERMPKIKLEKGLSFAMEEDLAIHIDKERRSIGTYSVIYSTRPDKISVIDRHIIKVNSGKENVFIKFI
jgi:CRISPR-associated protein Cas5h